MGRRWWLVLLKVLIAASLSLSSLQDEDEWCDDISSRESERTEACEVPGLFAEGSKHYLLRYTAYQHLHTSIDADLLNWHRHCVSVRGIHVLLNEGESREGTPVPTRSVDYLFVVEMPCNPGAMGALLDSIQALVELTRDRNVFHDVYTQFAFIVYSYHEEKLRFIYARDFAMDFPPNIHDLLFNLSASVDNCNSVSSYRTVSNALKVVGKSLRLVSSEARFHQRLTLLSNRSLSLWHRPYSDLHIVSITDIGAEHSKRSEEDHKLRRSAEHVVSKFSDILPSVPPYPLTLHSYFDSSNLAALSLLGRPEIAIRYPDCSHFRKAATLKALIAAKMGDSLQALLLSRGIEYQLHHVRELEDTWCLLNLSPALSTPLGVHPTFPDLCSVPPSKKSRNQYCSALHGWTERKAGTKTSDLFQDKVRLTDQYSSDHADIARSVQSSERQSQGDKVPIIRKLSINKRPSVGGVRGMKPVVVSKPRELQWTPEEPFIQHVIEGAKPVTLKGTVVDSWAALQKWNMSYLSHHMDTEVLELVKCTNNYLTFDPDHRAALKLNISLSYTLANLSTPDFFHCVQSSQPCFDGYKGHYYFGSVPDSLKEDVSPDNFLFRTDRDRKAAKQFMWISSAGMITHTHFDQDYNIFVQLVGRKRFTLWPPSQHELLYVYPRVHPMWHKSRVNYRHVDAASFPGFTRTRATQVELGPGDVLYVPPYTWHYVETLTPSVSLSTWSHDYDLYDHMNAIYRHDHKFDLLESQKGQMFVLRLYLDMMVHDLYGFNETTQFFARLVHDRFTGLEHLFPPSKDDPDICASSSPGKIPTCLHVHGYAKLDMDVVGNHFRALRPVTRDILFGDYVEEITAQVVGVRKMLAFFRYCFLGQEYYVTDIEDSEHLLWEHKDTGDSDE